MDATTYVQPLAHRLKVSPDTQVEATRLFVEAFDAGADNLEPEALAAAAIAVATAVRGDGPSQPRIARTAAVPDRELDRHISHIVSAGHVPIPQ